MTEVIETFKWVISKEDTKKHIVGMFNVDKAYKKLIFTCVYSPKYLSDVDECLKLMRQSVVNAGYSLEDYPDSELVKSIPLANHISWSIDSPKELLGTKHKHNPTQILEISESRSTYGFKNSKIYPGQWRVTASLTAILTDNVDIEILIEGEVDNEVD